MSSIFISHSSRDNATAAEISAWLDDKGHRSVFLDFDPATGIPAGRDWEKELYRQIRTCRAVIALCSEAWMASRWCFMELTYARALGKHVFPLRIDTARFDDLLNETQVVDFRTHKPDAFNRLWNGLLTAGLDPAEAFDWDGSRAAYPGLLAFQKEDAAIFFGRDDEIGDGLDLLNKCHRLGDTRLVVVLGASGSGKSSLVRAGMLPRLRRDTTRWFVLEPFRPRDDPAGELAIVLGRAFASLGQPLSPESIRQALTDSAAALSLNAPAGPWTDDGSPELDAFLEALGVAEARLPKALGLSAAQALRTLRASAVRTRGRAGTPSHVPTVAPEETGNSLGHVVSSLRLASQNPEVSVLLTIDQFEELLGHPPDHPCTRFVHLLGAGLARRGDLTVLGTMRSDFLGHFQQTPALSGLRYEGLSLGPMSTEDIAQVIERPAELAAIALGPGLVQALVDDARTQDALPLLAFTLHELAERFGGDGRIDLDEYKTGLGGVQAALARSAEELIAGEHLGRPQTDDLRRAFLRLVRITDDGTYARQVAGWADMAPEIHPLLEKFITARLLVSRDEGQGRVVEVAHEALFRSWTRLADWLKDSAAALRLRQQINAAAQAWDKEKPVDDLWRGARLIRARDLRDRADIPLNDMERRFVDASVAAEEATVASEQRRRRRRTIGLTTVAVGGIVLSIIAWALAVQATRARAAAAHAAVAAEERAREAGISAARARAAQNFAEHQRVQARLQARDPASLEARALTALAPKFLEQSKRHIADAVKLQHGLEQWKAETGAPVPTVAATLSLELLPARRSGSSLLLHYGTGAERRLALFDGGIGPDYQRSLKPRLEALRQQQSSLAALPIDLVVSSQTDSTHIGGLIRLVEELAITPAEQRFVTIGTLWTNAFVTPNSRPRPATELVTAAQRLGVPINRPFTKMVTLPEAGAARVHWKDALSITVLGPSLKYLRQFAEWWLVDASQSASERLPVATVKYLDDLTLESFSDQSLEVIPSPLDIERPAVPPIRDETAANLGSIVVLLELAGKRILLPADSRDELLMVALAQAGYADDKGNVELDAMLIPRGGGARNVSEQFFRRVKASHYVFYADGLYGNPKPEALRMLFDARRDDRRPFAIYFTHHPSKFTNKYPLQELCTLLRDERAAGMPYRVLTPAEGAASLAIHLLDPVPQLRLGVEEAACQPISEPAERP
jgi:hypothetical protein